MTAALLEVPGRAAEVLERDETIQRIAAMVAEARDVLYLGRGNCFPIAMEGALKLKEISYIHAEGYAAGEMKHGPIALIDEHVPVIVIAPSGPLFEKTVSNMQEVQARGGQVILISDYDGVEAAGEGVDTQRHAATLTKGTPGVLHGARSYLLQDGDGQVLEAHSISAGLDYPGVGPEHSWLKDSGRVKYFSATDREALDAFQLLSRLEGIIPALESAHALAHVARVAPQMRKDQSIAVCLSGRGDKDVFSVAQALGVKI